MKFFSPRGKEVSYEEWLNLFEPYYFLRGPSLGRRINARNQSSEWVEDTVCALLTKSSPLSVNDLTLIMAWKMGLIDHGKSKRAVVYKQNWATTLRASGQYGTLNFSNSIPYLAANISSIAAKLDSDPEYLFRLLPILEGFGPVYILTVLFFISHGRYPIYDRYAHIAALAIQKDNTPDSNFQYSGVQKWSDYQGFVSSLVRIRALGFTDPDNPSMFISRPVDRSLWVYGHFFGSDSSAKCR